NCLTQSTFLSTGTLLIYKPSPSLLHQRGGSPEYRKRCNQPNRYKGVTLPTTFNDRADQEEPEERSSTDNLLKKRSSAVLGLYPHDLHPGLVPGISVEEQRNTFGIDKIVFSVTAIFIVAFIAWGISSPESVASVSSTAYAWAMNNVAWLL